jgi:secreted Zn-dependent insulinase-like peptidase
MKIDKELYQVFEVDTCFSSWAMGYCLVGAESLEDLKAHAAEIFKGVLNARQRKSLFKEEYRVNEIKGVYTETPYQILERYSYVE